MSGGGSWRVYLLRSADGRASYVGIALDPHARLAQHNGERPGGARRTRAGRPWTLVACSRPIGERGDAVRAEMQVKRARGLESRCAALATLESGIASGEDEAEEGNLPQP